MVLATLNDETPSIVQIPKQIPKKELLQLMLLEWISNYKNFKKNSTPAIATKATVRRSVNGTIRAIFKRQDKEEPSDGNPPIFHTMMIIPKTVEKRLQFMLLNQMDKLFILIRLTVIFCGMFLDQECVNQVVTSIHCSISCQEVIHGVGHA